VRSSDGASNGLSVGLVGFGSTVFRSVGAWKLQWKTDKGE